MKKDMVLEYLIEITGRCIAEKDGWVNEELTSNSIAARLGMKRNVVSLLLNELNREQEVIKINTRPVYFLSKALLEAKLGVPVKKLEYGSLREFEALIENGKDPDEDVFSSLIGFNQSISHQVEQCKVAVAYPQGGLPVLVHGATGVGKSLMAQLMYEYAVSRELIRKDAPMVVVNCSEFADNPELLTANLFGYVKGAFTGADESRTGFVEEANGGFLFLDEIHRLSPEGQEKLFMFMDKGVFRRVGDSSTWKKSKVRLVGATTEDPREVLINTFLRRIPIVIDLPSLQERSQNERISLIYHFFSMESKLIKLGFVVSSQVMNTLLNVKFVGNIGELKNVIKYTCANAYYKHSMMEQQRSKSKEICINVGHIPDEFIKNLDAEEVELRPGRGFNGDVRINGEFDVPRNINTVKSTAMEELVVGLTEAYDSYRKDTIELEELVADCIRVVNSCFEKVEAEISDEITGSNIRLGYIKKMMTLIIEGIKNSYGLSLYANTANMLSYYVFFRSKNSYEYQKSRQRKLNELHQLAAGLYMKEYEIGAAVIERVRTVLGVEFAVEDALLLTLYIKGVNKNIDINRIRSLIIAHGNSTASSIAKVANRLLGQYVFDAVDMPFDSDVRQVADQLVHYSNSVNTEKGMLILVDTGSLEEIHKEIKEAVKGSVGIINNVSTFMAVDTGSKILSGMDMEDIIKQVSVLSRPKYKLIRNDTIKKRAILTICMTGIGTAVKIKDLLVQSTKDHVSDLEILPYDYTTLRNNGKKDKVFEEYNVIAIIGTASSKIEGISFVSVEELISEDSNRRIRDIFKPIAQEEDIQKINRKIVKLFSLQSVINHLTILNPYMLMNHLESVVDTMQTGLGRQFSNNVKISLYIHIGCLIERLVKNSAITSYENLEQFEQCQKNFMDTIKKSFSVIENTYNVQIPTAEIGYIFDIIHAY